MVSAAAPPPILGDPIDPPAKSVPPVAERLDRWAIGGIAYRAARRYSYATVGLLAAGTAYYLFLAMLSLLAFTYGVIAIVGADELATRLTDAISDALPTLVGSQGIDPDQLHLIRGRTRHLLVLLGVTPLLLVSFSSAALASTLVGPLLDAAGLHSGWIRGVLASGGLVLGYAVDVLVLWILVGNLGGIRPHRKPRLFAARAGAACAQVENQLLTVIVAWSLA